MNSMRARRYASSALVAVSILGLAACGGGKPSEADLSKKLETLYTEAGLPKEQAAKVSDCAAPKFLKEVSSDTLNKVMDSDVKDLNKAKVSKKDKDAVSKIATDCAKSVISQ